MKSETTKIKIETVILNARKKSKNPAGSGININPSIKIKANAKSISVFRPNIFITGYTILFFLDFLRLKTYASTCATALNSAAGILSPTSHIL